MSTILSNVVLKQARGEFNQKLDTIPTVWDKHVQHLPADTKTETFAFPGFTPTPREFLNERQVQGMVDFSYSLTNNTYELTMLINRETLEDDQTGGTIMGRMREMAEVWGTFKDSQFATLLQNGDVSGNNGWDGATFYNASRTIGDSGTIDNIIAPTGTPIFTGATGGTSSETRLALAEAKSQALNFADDTGRAGYNSAAVTNTRVICPAGQELPWREALNSTVIGVTGGTDNTTENQTSNEWGRSTMAEVDVLPYLASTDEAYVNFLGAERKPFVYCERSPLEIIFRSEPGEIAQNNGLLVLTRQRYILTYGDPMRSVLVDWA